MTFILLQNVAVRYDQALVLRDVYFRLAAGAAAGLPPTGATVSAGWG